MIYCIGDSHAGFFSGWDSYGPAYPRKNFGRLPMFESYRLGPVLAYSLHKLGSRSLGREKLFELLEKIPKGSRVLLCFGEIDCRTHLLRQAEERRLPIETVAQDCAEKYLSAVREVKALGFDVVVWAAIPSTVLHDIGPEYPTYGTPIERNAVTVLFNSYVRELCSQYGIRFISIFHQLVHVDGSTNMEYYADPIHLSQKAMPLALAALGDELPDFEYNIRWSAYYTLKSWMLNRIERIWHKVAKKLRLVRQTFRWHFSTRRNLRPPPGFIKRRLLKRLARANGLRVFVETGTYQGNTVAALRDSFDRIHTIELGANLCRAAQERFSRDSHVTVHCGDSAEILPKILAQLDRPALFWLDAHYSEGITAQGSKDTPIREEVQAILAHSVVGHVIAIDDVCDFGTGDYPTIEEIKAEAQSMGAQDIRIEHNILILKRTADVPVAAK